MLAEQQQLYRRLCEYELSDPSDAIGFVDHLMRSNGWNQSFAMRAMEEYKKFVFLAMVADHLVTPSDQIDQVWHLHLFYSDAYWNDFCPRVLGRPLHHQPTRGGAEQRQHFQLLYRATIASYRTYFGDPPVDLWPPVDVRFGRDLQMQRRPIRPPFRPWRWLRRWPAQMSLALVLMLLGTVAVWAQDASDGATADASAMLEMFLFFSAFAVTFLLVRKLVRPLLRRPARKDSLPALTNLELAYLADGPQRALLLTLAELVHRGLIIPSVDSRSLVLMRDRIGPLQGLAWEMVNRHKLLAPVGSSVVKYELVMSSSYYQRQLQALLESLQKQQLMLGACQRLLVFESALRLFLSFAFFGYLGPVLLFFVLPDLASVFSHIPHQDQLHAVIVYIACVAGLHGGLITSSGRTLWGDVVLEHDKAATAHGDRFRRIAVIGSSALTEGRLDSLRLLIEGVQSDAASSASGGCGCGC